VDAEPIGDTMQRPRRLLITVALTALLLLLSMGTASAHVHGITPLRCVAPADAGANAADDRVAEPAAHLFAGLVPANAGGAVAIGDGGFDTPACPAG
jgi:hypothetical protein